MGNCSSIKAETLERAKNDMMALPSYCAAYQSETGPVDDATAKIVVETWHLCMAGTAEPFIEAHRITPSLTPLVFFYNTYYDRFFSLSPEIRPLFKRSMVSQGRMLANMIKSVVVNITQDYNLFRLSLEGMARGHNKMGIKAEYYALSGIVLFYTMRTCLGEKIHTEEVRIAWTRLFARMMQVVIPIVVSNQFPGEGDEEDFMRIVKADTKEGEKAAKDSTTKTPTPPTGDKALDQTTLMVDGLDDLGDQLARDLKTEILAVLPSLIRDRTYKGVNHKNVLVGCELVDYLIVNKKADTRDNAVRMASMLWTVGLRNVAESDSLTDTYSFYYFLPDTNVITLSGGELAEMKITILSESKLADTQTYKLKTYPNAIIGASLVDWLLSTSRAPDRLTAVSFGRQLSSVGLRSCAGDTSFDDSHTLFTFDERKLGKCPVLHDSITSMVDGETKHVQHHGNNGGGNNTTLSFTSMPGSGSTSAIAGGSPHSNRPHRVSTHTGTTMAWNGVGTPPQSPQPGGMTGKKHAFASTSGAVCPHPHGGAAAAHVATGIHSAPMIHHAPHTAPHVPPPRGSAAVAVGGHHHHNGTGSPTTTLGAAHTGGFTSPVTVVTVTPPGALPSSSSSPSSIVTDDATTLSTHQVHVHGDTATPLIA